MPRLLTPGCFCYIVIRSANGGRQGKNLMSDLTDFDQELLQAGVSVELVLAWNNASKKAYEEEDLLNSDEGVRDGGAALIAAQDKEYETRMRIVRALCPGSTEEMSVNDALRRKKGGLIPLHLSADWLLEPVTGRKGHITLILGTWRPLRIALVPSRVLKKASLLWCFFVLETFINKYILQGQGLDNDRIRAATKEFNSV